jgi:hypothetical protein
MNLIWESLQLPLYTIWRTAAPDQIAYAVLHCTIGDVLIAAGALLSALLLVGGQGWPYARLGRVAVVAAVLGIGYAILSEWLNVSILRRWAYSELMPVVPVLRTGLSPLLQWSVIPTLGFLYIRQRMSGTQPHSAPIR